MCGISFVLSTETYNSKLEDFMKDSLIVNQVRGMHSTGIFQVSTGGEISYFKQATNASNFVGIKEAKELLGKTPRSRLTVGHVRHATHGAADKTENAHPFMVTREDGSKLIGVHNGNFRNFRNKKNSKEFDVDSAWAFQMLADEGADAFEYFDGAFALVWYDTRTPDVVYMARNKERPLYFMLSEDGKTIYGMSELGSLGWVTGRRDIKRDKEGFLYLDPGHIYKFDLKKPGAYDKVSYPAYDPTTTIHTPVSHVYDNDDVWEGGGMGYHAPFRQYSSPYTPGYTRPTERAPVVDYAAERTYRALEEVKAALKQARNKRDAASQTPAEDSPVIDKETLDRELEEGIADHIRTFRRKQSTELVPITTLPPMYLANVTDSVCDKDEIKDCQGLALYGLVSDFTPVLYDDTMEEVWGHATVWLNGKWQTMETTLRGIGPRRGKFLYKPERGAHRVTIVGYATREESNLPPCLVASEMRDSGKTLIMNRVDRLTRAH